MNTVLLRASWPSAVCALLSVSPLPVSVCEQHHEAASSNQQADQPGGVTWRRSQFERAQRSHPGDAVVLTWTQVSAAHV